MRHQKAKAWLARNGSPYWVESTTNGVRDAVHLSFRTPPPKDREYKIEMKKGRFYLNGHRIPPFIRKADRMQRRIDMTKKYLEVREEIDAANR